MTLHAVITVFSFLSIEEIVDDIIDTVPGVISLFVTDDGTIQVNLHASSRREFRTQRAILQKLSANELVSVYSQDGRLIAIEMPSF